MILNKKNGKFFLRPLHEHFYRQQTPCIRYHLVLNKVFQSFRLHIHKQKDDVQKLWNHLNDSNK